jgi:hypothetical protein
MTHARARLFLSLVAVALPVGFLAQQVRDTTAPEAAIGQAAINGVVVSTDAAPRPIRRAVVTVTGDLPGSRSTITDDEGRFAFSGLPAGRFTVTAAKAAYLPAAYGATRPGRPGTPIALARDQVMQVALQMARGAVVSGTIRDRSGHPLSGVRVGVINVYHPSGLDRAFSTGQFVETDDRGLYRVFGLEPSDYIITATHETAGSGEIGSRSTTDVDTLFAELQLRLSRSLNPPAPVGPAGSAGSSAPARPPAIRLPSSFGLAPTYYPGTALFRDAGRVKLTAGEEREGLDFQAGPVPVGKITGYVSGDVRNLAVVRISITIDGARLPSMLGSTPILSEPPNAEGRFTISNVGPGRFRLIARAARGQSEAPPPPTGIRGGASSAPTPPTTAEYLFAVADVDTQGQDVSGVSLALQSGATMTGRVRFDSDSRTPPDDLSTLRVGVLPVDGSFMSQSGTTLIGNTFTGAPSVSVNADGTFEIRNIGPGALALSCTLPADIRDQWWLRSAVAGGRDLLDSPLEIAPGVNFSDVVVTLSDRRTELSGTLQTPAGLPAPEYYVVVFPAERALWQPRSRRIQAVRPSTDGKFVVINLPPGQYLVAAMTDVAPNEWNEPGFLEQIAPAGVQVTLGEGEKKVQDLRIAR